jgi:tripartite-type tricarboxylate transporter receptor subunit TctC
VKGGQLKLLAVASPARMAELPEIPAIAETLPGFEAAAWFAIVAPPKTPQDIARKINADLNEAIQLPDIAQRLAQLSAEPIGGTVAETAAYMRREVERWHAVIKAANVKME